MDTSYKINKRMRAKFINEIRQYKETSGIGSIGLGKEKLFPGWSMVKRKYPKILEEFSDILGFMHPVGLKIRAHGDKFEKLFRIIEKDVNDAIWANRKALEDKVGNVQEFKNAWYNDANNYNLAL